ncbi:MAG TPA: hypothetical protein VMT83_03010 [Burkholderiaceae bacterium]|nr:hypothetical protein [Burkholderiaceae bacterium]
MVETLERSITTETVNRRARPRRPESPDAPPGSLHARPDDLAAVERAAPQPIPAATGLRAEEARWLPLVVPGFALLLLACTALILGMAAAAA